MENISPTEPGSVLQSWPPPSEPVSCHTALNYLHMIRLDGGGTRPSDPHGPTNHQSQLRCVIVNDD